MPIEVPFGKHEGRTLEWIFFHDPGYIWWLIEEEVDLREDEVKERFDQLVRRASHLRIPGLCPWCKERPVTRMFLTHPRGGGLAAVTFDCDVCEPLGGSTSVECIPSFYTPDHFRSYDKTGAEIMIAAIKYAYFGSSSARMTQKRMEDFFDDPNNFVAY